MKPERPYECIVNTGGALRYVAGPTNPKALAYSEEQFAHDLNDAFEAGMELGKSRAVLNLTNGSIGPRLGLNGVPAPFECDVLGAMKCSGDDYLWVVLVESQEGDKDNRQFVVWYWNGQSKGLGQGSYFPVKSYRTTDTPYRDALRDAHTRFVECCNKYR